eukprot:scaffold194556_cov28-Tisochrysis_lutea.AAC.3
MQPPLPAYEVYPIRERPALCAHPAAAAPAQPSSLLLSLVPLGERREGDRRESRETHLRTLKTTQNYCPLKHRTSRGRGASSSFAWTSGRWALRSARSCLQC